MIYRYIREDANPAIEVVAALARESELSIEWLATGKSSRSAGHDELRESSADYRADTFLQVPQYNIEVAAGDGRVPGDEEVLAYYAFRRDWVRQRGWTPGDLAIVICRGDSQEGLIDDGQPVLVNLGDTDISTEGLFVLRRDDTLLIKTVQLDFQGNALLRSNNPRYREIQVPREQITDIQIVGRAIWTDHVL